MNHAKKTKVVGAGLLLTFMLIVTACATSQPTPSDSTTPSNQATKASATLSHVPSGTSDLKWTAANQTLTVKVQLTGLAPNSIHAGHIHKGDCKSNGDIVYSLKATTADDKGVATSETTIPDVKDGIPQSGWYINIHNGGNGLTPELQKMQTTCGEITNSNPSTSSDQSVQLKLGSAPAPNQSASGNAQLSVDGGKLTVKITLNGLVANSTHIAHIHQGSCDAQGAGVLYPLSPVVADANGNGTSTSTVDQVTSIPASGWYINVHFGATAEDLKTQTGFDPIACGNVVTG